MLNIESDNATLAEYERIMGLNEDILRFMNIRIEEVSEEPSIMMQAKSERGERGSRYNNNADNAGAEKTSEEA